MLWEILLYLTFLKLYFPPKTKHLVGTIVLTKTLIYYFKTVQNKTRPNQAVFVGSKLYLQTKQLLLKVLYLLFLL